MTKILTTFVLLLLSLIVTLRSNLIEVDAAEAINTTPNSEEIVSKKLDNRAQILQKYLAQFDSPMQHHAQDFIDAAKLYNLDWKLLPAIAGVESTFGKRIPGGYNAYGWGVYGTQAIYFKSWNDGIYTVARGLRENYMDKGYTNPQTMNRIYAESPAWGGKVTHFMKELEEFALSFKEEKILAPTLADSKISADSAAPVLR